MFHVNSILASTVVSESPFVYDASLPLALLTVFSTVSLTLFIVSLFSNKKEAARSVGLTLIGFMVLGLGGILSLALTPLDNREQLRSWSKEQHVSLSKAGAEQLMNGNSIIVEDEKLSLLFDDFKQGYVLVKG